MKHIVAFSGGKDSTAMLLRMIELDMHIDEIVFADTFFEFPELYDYIERVEKYIGRKITVLKQPSLTLREYKTEQQKIIDKLGDKGIDVPQPKYKEGWTNDSEVNKFEQWFYGIVTRGKTAGKQRGFPLRLFPCWWTRESKVKPLAELKDKGDLTYIGIASDELHRMSSTDDKLIYPLIDWKWTEKDCIDYLNKKDMFNPLYVNFNRLGCWHCPKQGTKSLYVLWKNYPKLWQQFIWWDNENFRITGMRIKDKPIIEIGKMFESGVVPKDGTKYTCHSGCESVKHAFSMKQSELAEFIKDEDDIKCS